MSKNYLYVIILFVVNIFGCFSKDIPSDPNTVKGKLKNGLTYYIRENNYPENKVVLRLVVNAGSALENENQRGLAHFLEHMAFSGTKDFPGSLLIDTLQSVGVRFGKELNAYTSFDETVFYLPISSDKVDLGMRIVSNWAFHLNLADKTIDRERNVILEEMRLGSSSRTRLQNQYLPVIFDGSPYPNRLPIGTAEVIAGFEYNALRSFYKKWYRPELMAVIVVGDIKTDEAKKLLDKYFESDYKPTKKSVRPTYYPKVNKKIKSVIATDQEKKNCSVEVICKHPSKRIKTENDYKSNILDKLYSRMMDNRLEADCDTSDMNISGAEISYSKHFRFIDTYSLFALCDIDEVNSAFRFLVDEHNRVLKYGFSNNELEQAKKALIASYTKWYRERDKTASEDYADSFQTSFLYSQNDPGIEWEYEFVNKILPTINVSELNSLASSYMKKKERVIVITGPDNKNYPKEEDLKNYLLKGNNDIVPFKEDDAVDELMSRKPEKGSIIKEQKIDSLNIVKWTLSNGLNVYLSKTDFKDNEILYRATSDGGYSNVNDQDVMSAVNATRIQDESGVNGINNRQLKHLMSGKNIAITQSISYYFESMWGKTTPDDLESLMQLINLYHVSPYFDNKAASKMIKKNKSDYSYLKSTPQTCFDYFVDSIMNGGNFRMSPWPLISELEKVNFEKSMDIYKDRFSNAAGFNYIFVGNIDFDKMRDYVETYIASLPVAPDSKKRIKKWLPENPKTNVTYIKNINNEDKSTVKIKFRKYSGYNRFDAAGFDAFIDILNSRLFQSLRMEMSGVYGVSVVGGVNPLLNNDASLNLTFGCNPSMADSLLNRTLFEINKLWSEGPTVDELNRYKEKTRVSINSETNSNAATLTSVYSALRMKQLPYTTEYKLKETEQIDINSVINSARKYLDPEESIRFILMPKDFEKESPAIK
ncbi:MAG: insulinase family protein [Bacteroidales bacterium]|nr:insulinase family protein [Bacteroidales bacterium]